MDNFTQPSSDQPNNSRETPSQPVGPMNPAMNPNEYPPPQTPQPGPYAAPGQPGYPSQYGQPNSPSQYGQPGYPSQYGQPGYPSQYGQPGYPSQYGQPAGPSTGQFGAPAPMSGQYPGYGQQPPSQYPPAYPPGMMPPWQGATMPPGGGPRRRRPVWQWIVGAVGALLILCCVLGTIAAVASGGSLTAFVTTSSATATPAPTSTPVPTATTAPGVGDHMLLGHNYKQTARGDFQIVDPSSNFKSSDQFAFVVQLDGPIGATKATLALVKVEAGGTETVEGSTSLPVSNPNFTEFADRFQTAALMYGETPGVYKLEIQSSTKTLASAQFNYKG